MALSILAFNTGIEVMQLLAIGVIIPWLILLAQTPQYLRVRIALSVLAGLASVFWIVERTTHLPEPMSNCVQKLFYYAYLGVVALAVYAGTMYIWHRKRKRPQL